MWHCGVTRILFVHNGPTRFVRLDLEELRKRYQVTEYQLRSRWVDPISVLNQVKTHDLVFGWFASWHTFFPLLCASLLGKPSVLVIGGYDLANMPEIGYGHQRSGIKKWVSTRTMRFATCLVTNSRYSYEEALRNAVISERRLHVVYHGVPDPFGSLPKGPRARIALTVGNVDRTNLQRKGHELFVRAAGLMPNISFVLVGAWKDDAIDHLRSIATPNVTFTGWLSDEDLRDYYRRAAIYVQASRHEGFGMSVAEAMLAGCVPVVTRAGALPEVTGECGVRVNSPDPSAIADAIQSALASPDEARAAIRTRILENFPMRNRGEHLRRLIEALINGQVNMSPREYWDKIGKASTPGSGDNSGHFATDETGSCFYQLPKWTTRPQYWEYMQCSARVLDIGSGNGLQVGRLTQGGVFAVGCDISFALLKTAKENMVSHGISDPMLVQWDGFRMPFASNTFDRVTTNTVLQHVVDDNALDSIFRETARILRGKGLFLICKLVSSRDVQTAPHVKMRSTQTYACIAARHGLRTTKIRHVASTYIAIQSVYGRLLVRAVAPGNAPGSMGESIRHIPAPRARDNNRLTSLAKRLARRFVSDFANIADTLVAILHLDHRLAGQDEIVFEKETR